MNFIKALYFGLTIAALNSCGTYPANDSKDNKKDDNKKNITAVLGSTIKNLKKDYKFVEDSSNLKVPKTENISSSTSSNDSIVNIVQKEDKNDSTMFEYTINIDGFDYKFSEKFKDGKKSLRITGKINDSTFVEYFDADYDSTLTGFDDKYFMCVNKGNDVFENITSTHYSKGKNGSIISLDLTEESSEILKAVKNTIKKRSEVYKGLLLKVDNYFDSVYKTLEEALPDTGFNVQNSDYAISRNGEGTVVEVKLENNIILSIFNADTGNVIGDNEKDYVSYDTLIKVDNLGFPVMKSGTSYSTSGFQNFGGISSSDFNRKLEFMKGPITEKYNTAVTNHKDNLVKFILEK